MENSSALQTNTETPIKPSFHFHTIPLLIYTIIIILLTSGAFILGMRYSSQKAPSTIPTATIPTSIPTALPTANWKTYTNTKYLYKVEYPTAWYLQEGRNLTNIMISNFSLTTSRPGYEFYPGDMKIEIYSDNPEFISEPSTNEEQIITFAGHKAIQIIEEKTAKLSNNIKVTTKTKRIYIDKETNRYGIATYLANPTLEQEKLVNQILSTFKFLE